MPCMCWYQPSQEDLRKMKDICVNLVEMVKEANRIGDPLGMRIEDVHKLIDHLYTGKCDEVHGYYL